MPGTKYADRIIDGASAKLSEEKRLQEAIGTVGVHVKAELNAVDALHRMHGAAVGLVCAAIEITHCRLVAGGVIEVSTAVTAEQVHQQMRLERRGVAKMGTQAFTLTCLTPRRSQPGLVTGSVRKQYASTGPRQCSLGLYLQAGRQALHCARRAHPSMQRDC